MPHGIHVSGNFKLIGPLFTFFANEIALQKARQLSMMTRQCIRIAIDGAKCPGILSDMGFLCTPPHTMPM